MPQDPFGDGNAAVPNQPLNVVATKILASINNSGGGGPSGPVTMGGDISGPSDNAVVEKSSASIFTVENKLQVDDLSTLNDVVLQVLNGASVGDLSEYSNGDLLGVSGGVFTNIQTNDPEFAASTNASGFVELATNAESIAGSSGNLANTPAGGSAMFYDRVRFKVVSSGQTNSTTTFADSAVLQHVLGVGTWWIWGREIVASSSFATGGAKSRLNFTGTGTFAGSLLRGGAANTEPINQPLTYAGSSETINGTSLQPTQSLLCDRIGTLAITVSGTLSSQFALNAASGTATLTPGSFLVAIKIA